jgi:hypothetical protein
MHSIRSTRTSDGITLIKETVMMHACKLVFAAILALSACATDQDQEAASNSQPTSQIQSAKELDAYLRATPNSPLDRLPAAAKQRFIDSLVFTENGLASYTYIDLEALSPTEIYKILSLFGAEHTTSMITQEQLLPPPGGGGAKDYIDYECSKRATCTAKAFNICTSSC